MANLDQPLTTYSSTLLQKRAIPDMISLIDPIDTPVLDWLGMSSASKFNIQNLPNKKLEWAEDTYRVMSGTLNATAASDDTALTVTDATDFQIGDVILMPGGSEKAWISAVSGTTITVTRGYGTTDAATQATGTITILTRSRLEGADTDFGPATTPTTDYNYTQIFQAAAKVTRSEDKQAQYGFTSSLQYQEDKKMPELFRDLERALFYGERLAGSATTPRGMGGLDTFITDNTLATALANLTIGDLRDLVEDVHLDGGMPDTIILHPTTLNALISLYENTNYLRIERVETTLGMSVEMLHTPWGDLRMLQGRHVPTTRLYMLQSEYIGVYEFDSFGAYDVPRTGDFVASEIIGEYSLVVMHDEAHVRINLS